MLDSNDKMMQTKVKPTLGQRILNMGHYLFQNALLVMSHVLVHQRIQFVVSILSVFIFLDFFLLIEQPLGRDWIQLVAIRIRGL